MPKKGGAKGALLSPEEVEAKVRTAIDELLGPSKNVLSVLPGAPLRIDISKPNIHDSKSEFLAELTAVEDALKHILGLFRAMWPGEADTDAEVKKRTDRIQAAIDLSASRSRLRDRPTTMTQLVRNMQVDAGLSWSAIVTLVDLKNAYEERLGELKDQEAEFWSTGHRPPNHYARTIALRLARLYAREKGIRPTFGTARDGGHPSTAYGLALERIFAALGIKANVKNAATWAIDQLLESDLQKASIVFTHSNAIMNLDTLRDLFRNAGTYIENSKKGLGSRLATFPVLFSSEDFYPR